MEKGAVGQGWSGAASLGKWGYPLGVSTQKHVGDIPCGLISGNPLLHRKAQPRHPSSMGGRAAGHWVRETLEGMN